MKVFLNLFRLNFRAAMALRQAFIIRTVFTIVFNLVWIVTWWVFFKKFPTVGGWELKHVYFMYGLTCLGFGALNAFAYGIRLLPRYIDQGNLDVFLTQPKNLLMKIAASATEPAGFGDMAVGLFLIFVSGVVTWLSLPMVIIIMLIAVVVSIALNLVISCLAFWLPQMHDLLRDFYIGLQLFANNPNVVYTGVLKIISFTMVPVAFMSYLPIEAVRLNSWWYLFLALLGALATAAASILIFNAGLKRYESGNQFTYRI